MDESRNQVAVVQTHPKSEDIKWPNFGSWLSEFPHGIARFPREIQHLKDSGLCILMLPQSHTRKLTRDTGGADITWSEYFPESSLFTHQYSPAAAAPRDMKSAKGVWFQGNVRAGLRRQTTVGIICGDVRQFEHW
jgi:hypothetical protein